VSDQHEVTNPRIKAPIAVIVSRFPLINEAYILREINELERQGHPVLLLPVIRESAEVMHEEARPWLERALHTPLLSWPIFVENLRQMFRRPATYFGILWAILRRILMHPRATLRNLAILPKAVHLARLLPEHGVEHLHAYFAGHTATIAWVISRFSQLTYSFTVHGPDVFVHRPLLREKIRRAKFIRSVSTFNKAFLIGLYPEVTGDKIEVIHIGVNPDVYRRADERSEHPEGALQLLTVAGLNPFKGMIYLIEACGRLQQAGVSFECRIVGDGPLRGEISERIREVGLADSVRLLGSQPQHVIARLMGECDIFVLPSMIAPDGQMDGIPIALIEAMATARPVIGAAISGIPELISHGTHGLLVDSTNPEQLAAHISRLASDSELRRRLGEAARERVVRHFNVRQTVANLIELFDRRIEPASIPAEHLSSIDWAALGVRAVSLLKTHERRDSSVAEVITVGGEGPRELIVKKQKGRSGESRPPGERALHEFSVMEQLHARLPESNNGVAYGVPRPLQLDQMHAAVVMERARGASLEDLILQLRRSAPERLTEPVRYAGAWLRELQKATSGDASGDDRLALLLDDAIRDLELAAAADPPLRLQRPAIERKMHAIASAVASTPLRLAGAHGDYWPGNLFASENRIEVIDFEGYGEGLPLEDVAYFMIHLELYFSRPGIRRPLPRLTAAFIEEYGEGRRVDDELLKLMTAIKALRILSSGLAAGGGDLRNWWRRRVVRNIISRTLQ
jgi:colanic acid/amylovoran biosynthesis glycosyltransferase